MPTYTKECGKFFFEKNNVSVTKLKFIQNYILKYKWMNELFLHVQVQVQYTTWMPIFVDLSPDRFVKVSALSIYLTFLFHISV